MSAVDQIPSPLLEYRVEAALFSAAALLSLAVSIYVLTTTLAMIVHDWSALPVFDQWRELIFNIKQVFSPWLYSQHVEHRILFPRLLFAVDTFAFGETNKFTTFCNVLIPLCLVALLVWLVGRGRRPLSERIWIVGLVTTFLFSAMQFENFLMGWVAFFGVELAVTASIFCLVLGSPGRVSLTAAICLEAVALYTQASGAVILVLAIPLAVWAGRSRYQVTVLAVAAAALLASYLHGYVTPPSHSDPLQSIERPGAVAVYAIAEIGSPFGQFFRPLTIAREILSWDLAFGAYGFALFCWAIVFYLRRRREVDGPRLVFLGLAAYTFGVSLITASGRLRAGPGQALVSRYTTPMLLFWLSLGMLAILELRDQVGKRLLAMWLSLPMLIALACGQSAFARAGRTWTMPRAAATTALLARVDDAKALWGAGPLPDTVDRQAAKLRALHLSIFADPWSRWLDTPLAAHVAFTENGRCRGGIATTTPVPGTGGRALRVGGWAWDRKRDAAPWKIVLTDGAGRVVGYGLSGFPNPGGAPGSGWRGHVAAVPDAALTAYALIEGERLACRLTPAPRSASR